MAYPDTFDSSMLARAVKDGGTYSFSLGTADIKDLGLTDEDDIAQVCAGGRFDLTPWRKWGKPPQSLFSESAPMTPMHILHDASRIAAYLYLNYEQSGGADGMGDVSATYNALNTPALRVVHVDLNHA